MKTHFALLITLFIISLLVSSNVKSGDRASKPNLVAHWRWSADEEQELLDDIGPRRSMAVLGNSSDTEKCDPALVPFRGSHALRFSREEQDRVNLGQGRDNELCIVGALSLSAVVQIEKPPPMKVSIVSKWKLVNGGRSYELGLTASRRLFFTISESGSWDARARQLIGTRELHVGAPYLVSAVYIPRKLMALYVNGFPSGRLTLGVPGFIFDSPTRCLLGNRDGAEGHCGFDGLIGDVWIHSAVMTEEDISVLAHRIGLDAPPAPEIERMRPPYSLDKIRAEVKKWYDGLQAPGQRYGAYRMTPRHEPGLYASADVAWIRYVINDLDLRERQRSEWVDFLQDQQNPADGSYRHKTRHCRTHAFCHATGALSMLGAKHRYEPKLLKPYTDVHRIPKWLDKINWVNQWGASHDIWGAGLPIVCSDETPDIWRETFFNWLDAEVDPRTGFWRRGVKARTPMEYLGGAFHIWPIYAAVGRPIRYPERVIDSVLKLQTLDGSIGGGWNYGNMDGVWILQYLSEQTPYRRADIKAALLHNLQGLIEVYENMPENFLSSAHSTESRIAALAILQAELPDQFRSSPKWRNPWHERSLFAIKLGKW